MGWPEAIVWCVAIIVGVPTALLLLMLLLAMLGVSGIWIWSFVEEWIEKRKRREALGLERGKS